MVSTCCPVILLHDFLRLYFLIDKTRIIPRIIALLLRELSEMYIQGLAKLGLQFIWKRFAGYNDYNSFVNLKECDNGTVGLLWPTAV